MVVVGGCEGVYISQIVSNVVVLEEEGVEAVRLNFFVVVCSINKSIVDY